VLPRAFSNRTAISGDTPALRLIRRDNAARVTPRALAPSVTLTPNSSRQSRIMSPGWLGFFMGMVHTRYSEFRCRHLPYGSPPAELFDLEVVDEAPARGVIRSGLFFGTPYQQEKSILARIELVGTEPVKSWLDLLRVKIKLVTN